MAALDQGAGHQGAAVKSKLLGCVCVLLAACSDSKPKPVAVTLDEPSTATAPVKPIDDVSMSRVPEFRAQRENTVPDELGEFGIQAPIPALDDLRDKAKEQIGPNNADAELEKLRAEMGDKQP